MRKVEPSIGPVDIVGGEEKSQLKGHLRELRREKSEEGQESRKVQGEDNDGDDDHDHDIQNNLKSHLCD